MSLEDLRKKIDETDARIVKLISERIKIVREIGREKNKQGKQIEDTEREGRVLENIRKVAQEENLDQEDINSIYRQIVNMSKSVQGMIIAFQGEIGAYSEAAASNFF